MGTVVGPQVIALLTDFGDGSVYVGVMKGVIAALAPGLTILDVTHSVSPQCVPEAAFLLRASRRYFPPGTTFVTVVDPGVGGSREIVLVRASGRVFLAPDNGLLPAALGEEALRDAEVRSVRERRYFLPEVSATFHGRDIFAPVAARLASGEVSPEALGPELDPGRLARLPSPREAPGAGARGGDLSAHGTIVHVDRFGNLVSDVETPTGARPRRALLAGGREVSRSARTYAEATPGEPFVYTGSFGTVEIAIPLGDARAALALDRGAAIRVFFEADTGGISRGPEA